MNIKQRDDERLRLYVTRLKKKALLIDKTEDKVLVTTFTNGLQSGKFLFSVYKNNPKNMADMLYQAIEYMNAEDAVIVKGGGPKKREKRNDPHLDRGRKAA